MGGWESGHPYGGVSGRSAPCRKVLSDKFSRSLHGFATICALLKGAVRTAIPAAELKPTETIHAIIAGIKRQSTSSRGAEEGKGGPYGDGVLRGG